MNQDNVTHLSRDVRFEARPVLHVATPRPPFNRQLGEPTSAPHKKFVAKGHDAQLMDAQMSHAAVTLNTISGATFDGTISRRDKFTITLRDKEGQDEIFYKHAIESVRILRPQACSAESL